MDWTSLIRDFGMFGGLVLFFVWWTWQKSNATEKFVQETMVGLIVNSTEAIKTNTEVLRELTNTVAGCGARGKPPSERARDGR